MHIRYTKSLFCLIITALFLLNSNSVQAKVYLDITSADLRKVSMAVPYFTDKQRPDRPHEAGQKMSDLMGRALTFHGFVSLIDPLSYGGKQDTDWAQQGAEFTVLGQYETRANNVIIELRLVDVHSGRMILGRRFRGPFTKHHNMIKKFCDEIILKLTGERGVSLSKIAFTANSTGHKEIYLADVLGDDIKQVTKHEYLAVSPRFSPKGDKLAYTSYHRGNPNLYITELNKNKQTTRAISRRKGLNMAPAWSPSGKSLVVTLSKDGNPDLYLMDTRGKIKNQLTSGEGINVSPSWSPDGKRIAFVSDRSGTPQIYVMDVRKKSVRRITYLGNENTTPNWSPKGDYIAYTGRVNGNYQILMIKPEGGSPVQLTNSWGDHESPCWSPDGRQVVFSRKRYDKQEICAIFKNGTGLRPLFKIDGLQFTPQWSSRMNL